MLDAADTMHDSECMDGTANQKNHHRTLAAQPAAAAHVGASVIGGIDTAATHVGDPAAIGAGSTARRSRLERMLLAARQMQQH